QQDPAVYVADSLNVAGSLPNSYWLPPGAYQFVVTSPVSGGSGSYSRTTTFVADATLSTGSVPGCLIATAPGVSITSSLTGAECNRAFVSRLGESPGRHFLLYLRPGKAIQVTYRPTNTAIDNDAYLEVFDI